MLYLPRVNFFSSRLFLFQYLECMKSLNRVAFLSVFIFNLFAVKANNSMDDDSKNFIDISSSYVSNYNAFGSTNTNTTQPSLSFLASYTYNNGIYASVNHAIVFNSDTTMSKATNQTDFSLGYNLKLLPGLSANSAYTHYYYSNKASTLNTGYTGDFLLGLSFDTTLIYASASVSYILGNSDNSLNIATHLGLPLEFELTDAIGIIIQPTFDAGFGNQTYYNEWAFKQYKFLIPLANILPNYRVGDLFEPIAKTDSKEVKIYKLAIKRSDLWTKKLQKLNKDSKVGELFDERQEFNTNTLGFSVPLYISYNNFLFNFSVTGLKPQNTPSWMKSDWVYLYNAGLTYSIDW